MYKNQLQELAQRSCFNLPSYTCIREGPDHAPRFKAVVTFNGESFESPSYCSTLRQAEHAAAEVALNSLSSRGPSHSLAARILDETGFTKTFYKRFHKGVGAPLPHYTTYRSGLGHQPVFTGKVELAGIIFTGEQAKNKKQAEKNAALAAWQSLKQLAQQSGSSSAEQENTDELEQVTIARAC
ncbi:Double-stranded RNA-binding protein 2 [Bienertia sinuspersici]